MYNKKKAVTYMILATLFFALMSFFVKLTVDVSSMEKAMYRNFLGVFIIYIIIMKEVVRNSKEKGWKESLQVFKPKNPKLLLYRSIFGTIGVALNFYAIDHLTLADSTVLIRMSPFFTVIAAALFLNEKLTKKVIISMFISFIGVLLVVQPSFDIVLLPYASALLSALAAGMAYTFLRVLGSKGERGDVVVFYFSLFSTIALIPFAITNYTQLSHIDIILVLLSSLFAMIAQLCVTAAYKYAPANEVSVYLNVQVIFTAVLGILFLNEIPNLSNLSGYVIIILASCYAFGTRKPKKEIVKEL